MNNRRSKRAPAFTAMHFALILLCLVLVSAHATMGLYASYKTECSGTDSARVAKFDVEIDYNKDENKLTITNNSEVTVEYNIEIVETELPEGVGVSLRCEKTGNLEPGSNPAEIPLEFVVEDNSTSSGEIEILFTVTVTQVD